MQFVEPIIGGLAGFMLGALWYTKLFGKAWQAETGLSDEDAQKDAARTHGLALVMMIIMCFILNFIIGMHPVEEQTFTHGGFHGIMLGMVMCVPTTAINYLYQRKSMKLFLIDASYLVLLLGLAGSIMAVLKLA